MISNQNVAKHRSGHRRLSLFLLAVFLPVTFQFDLWASLSKSAPQLRGCSYVENPFKGKICTNEVSYDLVGNRLAKSTNKVNPQTLKAEPKTFAYYYNANDQLLQEETSVGDDFQSATYAYDANGSLISKIVTPDPNVGGGVPPAIESATYTYNLENRLASAQIIRSENDQDLNITANYLYNQSGIRVKADSTVTEVATNQQIAETNRTFLIDPNNPTGYAQVLEEYSPQAMAPTVSYTLGTDIISQATHTPSSTNHSPSFLLYDGHGSTRLVTDSSGSITDRMSYDAYGMMLGLNPTSSAPPTTALLYSGEQFDVDLQQQYLRARYYNQGIGAFNRLDPFVGNDFDPQSLHKYTYTHNDPINGIDPSGLFTLLEILIVNIGIEGLLRGVNLAKKAKSKQRTLKRLAKIIIPLSMTTNFAIMSIEEPLILTELRSVMPAVAALQVKEAKKFKKRRSLSMRNIRRALSLARLIGRSSAAAKALGVPIKTTGFPNFADRKFLHPLKPIVFIGPLKGSRATDFAAANGIRALGPTPVGYTWHHHEVLGVMMLVKKLYHAPWHRGSAYYYTILKNRKLKYP